MSLYTFTSDLGLTDYYVAALKGRILSQKTDSQIIDITHSIGSFNKIEATMNLKYAYKHFPKNTIHIFGVLPTVISNSTIVIALADGHYFVSYDDGYIGEVLDECENVVYRIIENSNSIVSNHLHLYDKLIDVALDLSHDFELNRFGVESNSINNLTFFKPYVSNLSIDGTIVNIDNFGNAISNVSRKLIEQTIGAKEFVIEFKKYSIQQISKSYNQVPNGSHLALYNYAGYLELAINQGSIADLMDMKYRDTLKIIF